MPEEKIPERVEEMIHEDKIPLRLLDQEGTLLEIKVRRSVPFRKILDTFAQRVEKDATELRLLLNGKVLNLNQTPYDIAIDGNELLEVVASQIGGYKDVQHCVSTVVFLILDGHSQRKTTQGR